MLFKEIIGQKQIKERLIKSVQEGRIAHAQLFYGKSGAGVLPIALAYAQYICCTNRSKTDSCGVCASCRAFAKLAHPDLHFVFPIINIKNSMCNDFLPDFRKALLENPYLTFENWHAKIKKENTMPIIYTREGDEIIRKLGLKPFQADYKIMIIWCAEKMNEECANKVLKIIEEPQGQTVFLLISENTEKIISTILSRTQPLFFPPLSNEDLRNALTDRHIYVDDGDVEFVLKNAKGSWVDLLREIEQNDEQREFLETFINMMRLSLMFKIDYMKELNAEIYKMGRSLQIAFLQFSQRMLRESFIYNLNNSDLSYINKAEQEFLTKFAPIITEKNIEPLMNEFALAEAQIEQNGNARIIFFDLMIQMNILLKNKNK
ncbi:MAG: DNA polymerase III subunit [Prevotellaceae bacterium]|jgi:DNA polymerase-3 subunit delta'|nr:DNA polymerase III subunit [Prevotellaceae bacterium]